MNGKLEKFSKWSRYVNFECYTSKNVSSRHELSCQKLSPWWWYCMVNLSKCDKNYKDQKKLVWQSMKSSHDYVKSAK